MIKITDYAGIGGDLEVFSFAAGRLNIDGVEVIVIHNEKILNKFDSDKWHVDAIMHKTPVPNTYELIVRERTDDPLDLILCHEAIHLSQFVRGDLSLDMDRKIFTWKGKTYTSDYEYQWRPWEREAFNGQGAMLRAYRRSKRPKCR